MIRLFRIVVSLYYVYRVPKIVKVKAYKRVRRGKIENVRSHDVAYGDDDVVRGIS